MTVANGAKVFNGTGYIGYNYSGYNYGGNNNAVLVTDPGSVWSNNAALTVGYTAAAGYSTGNSLTVSNGGAVYCGD